MTKDFGKRIQINIVLKLFGCILLVVVAGYRLSQLTTIHVLFDEFGYSATAAYYNGYDWSSLANQSPYYSYGLSLILSIIMRVSQGNMALYYQLGIILNIALLMGSFLISCNIGKRLFKDIPEYIVITASFCISFYSNTIVQTNILWTETLLYFLFWGSSWFLLRMIETSKKSYVIALATCVMYMYMVHQRALAIIIAACIVVVFHFIIRKDKKQILLFSVVILGLLVVAYLLKSDLKANLWNLSSQSKDANDYSGQISKVRDILTSWTGMKAFILSLTGKVYYILVAGFMIVGMFFAGFAQLLKKKECKNILFYVYVILCLLGALGISSIFMLNGNRQDTLIYGRYTEYVIGPILLVGILFLWERKISKKTFYIMNIGAVVTAILVYIKLKNTGFTVYNIVCAFGLSSIFKNGQPAGWAPIVAVAIALVIGLLMYHAAMHLNGFMIRIAAMLILPMILWNYTNAMAMDTVVGANVNNAGYGSVAQSVKAYAENGAVPVYYLTEEESFESRYIEIIQYLLPEISIDYVQREDIEKNKGIDQGIVVVDENCFDVFDLLPQYKVLEYDKGMIILAHTNNKKLLEKNVADGEFLSEDKSLILTDKQMHTKVAESVDAYIWRSTGEQGYLLYGPYISLSAGKYVVNMTIDTLEENTNNLVKFDVYADGILAEQDIYLEDEKNEVSVSFTLSEDTNQIEFRLYGYKGCYIKINNIYVRQMN